ncbi:MAG: 4-phosphopantetheinyl transferase [Sphingobacteriales bacterium 17-39-43]|nr:MAG: 4-phosphopantetheinyl transferase [Sphingobacteriales bacterium 16-39-50]OZA25640.1 MAG: 4-phosphopantetheinyl transferase [Sphingobacteriales bacterium 17-39-43]OZA56884.1 MAG: 4-phosphopantetheinyl transferase [Sphingobacteriales bacterium 39-40-5]
MEMSVNQITAQRTFAVGNDLVHIENFKLSLSDLFKNKVYTPAEIAYCESFTDSLQRYASTWAAKEAIYKAIKQLDPSPLGWKKIEISRAKKAGMPTVVLPDHLKKYELSLTISHDSEYAWALALINAIV